MTILKGKSDQYVKIPINKPEAGARKMETTPVTGARMMVKVTRLKMSRRPVDARCSLASVLALVISFSAIVAVLFSVSILKNGAWSDGLTADSIEGAHEQSLRSVHNTESLTIEDQPGMFDQIYKYVSRNLENFWKPANNAIKSNDVCAVSIEKRLDCYPGESASAAKCTALGCCWSPSYRRHVDGKPPWCFFKAAPSPRPQCAVIRDSQRVDCHPEPGVTADSCLSRGCCWWGSNVTGVAWCFYPQDEGTGYILNSLQTPTRNSVLVDMSRRNQSRWPNDISHLQMAIYFETDTRIRMKIYDPNNKRYEVPIETPPTTYSGSNPQYNLSFGQIGSKFTFDLSRKFAAPQSTVFSIRGDRLTFSDQFIELTTPSASRYLYGLGEHRSSFAHDTRQPLQMAFWSRDQGPTENANLYGVHPFFLGMDAANGNKSFGVFLLNSNALEFVVAPGQPAELTFRTTGGILDFYVFFGPNPDDVVRQYSDVIGHPAMPPHWSLGFHLCRWGYGGTNGMQKVIARMRKGKFPYDTQWNDIDYMTATMDWTYDKTNFAGLPGIVTDLHNHNQHYVIIVDPAIRNLQGYEPYDDGMDMDVFIKETDGSSLVVGKVWPGTTVFPDFTHPRAEEYWQKQALNFHNHIKYDGLWIDMNEPSNFVDGSLEGCPLTNKLDYPPYVPNVLGGNLRAKTICPSSKQHLSSHYNLHSMYGYHEHVITNRILPRITNKRQFIISRSTFPGSGQYGGHWTGDNNARWRDLYFSIPGILSFNMFGIPLVGADICGFNGPTNEELCTRWMQLGAFYPFMRNHNSHSMPDQDPASPLFSSSGQDIMRNALLIRYKLITFLYTQFYIANVTGRGIARPLFFQYPRDAMTYTIDKQFLWGENFLISPVLNQGATAVLAYFPRDKWYDYYNGSAVTQVGRYVALDAPISKINVHIRGGSIIPYQEPEVTTVLSRKNGFKLLVALPDHSDEFTGQLYWDNGDSVLNDASIGNLITFTGIKSENGSILIFSDVKMNNYQIEMNLEEITIYGVQCQPEAMTILTVGSFLNNDFQLRNTVLKARFKISLLTKFTLKVTI